MCLERDRKQHQTDSDEDLSNTGAMRDRDLIAIQRIFPSLGYEKRLEFSPPKIQISPVTSSHQPGVGKAFLALIFICGAILRCIIKLCKTNSYSSDLNQTSSDVVP